MPALWLTALHAGGTGLAPEMPHREKLLAELGGLIWGFGWWENGHCRCGSYRVAGTTPGCAAGYHSRQRYPRHFLEAPLRLASGLRAYLHDGSGGWGGESCRSCLPLRAKSSPALRQSLSTRSRVAGPADTGTHYPKGHREKERTLSWAQEQAIA